MVSEAEFSSNLIDLLLKTGYKGTFKVSTQTRRGLPDIYIPSGIWCESKVLAKSTPMVKRFPMFGLFSKIQVERFRQLWNAGDFVFVAIRYCHFDIVPRHLDDRFRVRVLYAPWPWVLEKKVISINDLKMYAPREIAGKFKLELPPFLDIKSKEKINRKVLSDEFGVDLARPIPVE